MKGVMFKMKRIAVIEGSYVRDAQVFNADPAIIENDPNWDENFSDLNCYHFIGIFEGEDENAIYAKAAANQGVHADIISLIDFDRQSGCIGCRQRPLKPNTENLDEQDMILCPACGYGLAGADDDYFGFPKYCSECGQKLAWNDNPHKAGEQNE
jgi:DNA-directed RNA polymerase subunit RPC12/RpoP